MSLTSCTILFTTSNDKVIYVSNTLFKQLQLVQGSNIRLRLGQRDMMTTVKQLKRKGSIVQISSSVRQFLKIPRSGACYIQKSGDRELRIGPLIGILTSGSTRTQNAPFGTRSPLIKQFLNAGTNKAFYFAFTPNDINWQDETVNGFFVRSNGTWHKASIPLPDVVYNKLASRIAESTSNMESFKSRFTRRKIPFFNWGFFDKWDVYRLLEGDPSSKYVPESHVNPPAETIKEMLEKHQFVYLKPTGGSLGKGIYRITYHPKRGYFSRFRRGNVNVLLRFSSFQGLMRTIHRQSKLQNYVVQQGIRLIEIDQCPIDFRFHMHKNAQNQWVVAGIGAKKAGRGSVTTHIKNGGQLMTPEQVFNKIYGSKTDEMLQKSKQVAVRLAEAIELRYPHLIGELGFDLGIDREDNIWMFEANAKPGRSIFKHPSLRSQGRSSLSYIFEYCLYLSKFAGRSDA